MTSVAFVQLADMVDGSMRLRRSLWQAVLRGATDGTWIRLDDGTAAAWRRLAGDGHAGESVRRAPAVDLRCLESHYLTRLFLRSHGLTSSADRNLAADLAYLIWRNIKRAYKVCGHVDVVHVFRACCESLRPFEHRPSASIADAELLGNLRSAVAAVLANGAGAAQRAELANQYVELFIEVCFSLENLDRGGDSLGLRIRPEWLDPSFLLARLYGSRTSIPGFDLLFEGGINLADPLANPVSAGRTILIRGQFNAGKSILGLTLAAEVARRGGLATIVCLDESLDSLKGYLSSFDLADEPVREYDEPSTPPPRDADVSSRAGKLRLFYSPEARKSLKELLARIEAHLAAESTADPEKPRLLIVDPVNSIVDPPEEPEAARAQITATIQKIREHYGNVVLVAETVPKEEVRQAGRRGWTDDLPYIADVVIDLFHEHRHGYDQRYMQVSKSRFQRERRGPHPISFVPGQGMVVSPMSVAFRSEFHRPRYDDEQREPIQFGIPDLDNLLCRGAVARGDTVALRGPGGSYKTLLGLHFLAADREPDRANAFERRSLFLTDRDESSLSSYVSSYRLLLPNLEKKVTFAPLPRGYVQPGRLLREIQNHFENARAHDFVYDRVLIGHVGRWDRSCPFIREDAAFGDALVDLLRWEGAAAVIICSSKKAEAESALQRSVVDRARLILDLERFEFQGAQRVLMRAVRTATPPISRDWHELTLQGGRLQLDPSLLRVKDHADGTPSEAQTVDTTLHLFQVGQVQERYHQSIELRLRSVLNTHIKVEGGIDRAALGEAARLGPVSVGSHLRIVQIDEFQLPALKYSSDGRSMLQPFPAEAGARWAQDPGICSAIVRHGTNEVRDTVVAFPYYKNIAFLTYDRRNTGFPERIDSWATLATLVQQKRKRRGLVFNFARRPEDHNCLFLEIALSLRPDFRGDPACIESLLEWLRDPAFLEALEIFHKVCRPAHLERPSDDLEQGPQPWSAVYTRMWFTALRFWMDREPSKWKSIEISPLPRGVALSGEWYLGVWAHSAVPGIGLKIIDSLTSIDAQWERLRLGIGLPVDAGLYNKDPLQFFPGHLDHPDLDVGAAVSRARFRSQIYKYHQLAPILSEHLLRFVGLPLTKDLPARIVAHLLANVERILEPRGSPA